jgi:thiol-disulfide isomerase/thioredoxin
MSPSSPRPLLSAPLLPRLALAAVALAFLGACAHDTHGATPVSFLPPLTLQRFPEGGAINMASERGHVLVLDFWATWCEPCKAAIPEWAVLEATYRDRGVRLYAVSVDGDLNQLAEFLRLVKMEVPVLLDRDAAVAEGTLKMTVVPTVFIVDRQGAIRSTHQGYAPGDVKAFAAELDRLLAEK